MKATKYIFVILLCTIILLFVVGCQNTNNQEKYDLLVTVFDQDGCIIKNENITISGLEGEREIVTVFKTNEKGQFVIKDFDLKSGELQFMIVKKEKTYIEKYMVDKINDISDGITIKFFEYKKAPNFGAFFSYLSFS